MKSITVRTQITLLLLGIGALALGGCGTGSDIREAAIGKDTRNKLLVSVRDQRLLLLRDDKPVKSYVISTSKFGLGTQPGSYRTPLGRMEIAKKIGDGYPPGMVFKGRRPTGEVIQANAPLRDPIVSRILWLNGREPQNRNTFQRFIYIHGTAEEWRLGKPASYGCIRMGMNDVVDLYNRVGEGAEVIVMRDSLLDTPQGRQYAQRGERELRSATYTTYH
jgi:lipoprotein-anchoring transpeptidase ErfK/SrfK